MAAIIVNGTVNINNMGGSFPMRASGPRLALKMTLPEFIAGYEAGLYAARHGDDAGQPITDTELIEALRNLIDEGQFASDDSTTLQTLQFAIGSLLGVAVG